MSASTKHLTKLEALHICFNLFVLQLTWCGGELPYQFSQGISDVSPGCCVTHSADTHRTGGRNTAPLPSLCWLGVGGVTLTTVTRAAGTSDPCTTSSHVQV